jgi:hypothetical protein
MLAAALTLAQADGLVERGDKVVMSHKLRADISISVLTVGDGIGMERGASAAHLRMLDRTPSAADLTSPLSKKGGMRAYRA